MLHDTRQMFVISTVPAFPSHNSHMTAAQAREELNADACEQQVGLWVR